jgi:hypothetical protein
LSLAYHKAFGHEKQHTLSLGLQGVLVQKNIDFSQLAFEDQFDFSTGGTPYQTGENLGRQLELVGVVQPKAVGDNNITAVEVVSSFSEIRRGDRLLPMLAESSIDAFFIPQAGNLPKAAHIIDIPMKSTYVGKYDTVIIDKGARENLKPGDVFGIVRPGAEVVDNGPDNVAYEQDSSIGQKLMNKQSTVLSADHIGEVMVIKVYQKTSLAIVMNSRDMVRAGYVVENP